jgi:predicted nucleic acid-binding Zn ribbon protein
MELKNPECVDTPWCTKVVMYKECPVCGEILPIEAVFCDNCNVHIGEPENKCIVCGESIPAKWKYCDTCWENLHGGN